MVLIIWASTLKVLTSTTSTGAPSRPISFGLPDPAEYSEWLESHTVRMITVAPELPGAFTLIEKGVGARHRIRRRP